MAEKRRFIFGAAAVAMSVAAAVRPEVAIAVAIVVTLASFYCTRRYWINVGNVGLVLVTALVAVTMLERIGEEVGFPLSYHLAALSAAWVLFGYECGIRYNPLITPRSS